MLASRYAVQLTDLTKQYGEGPDAVLALDKVSAGIESGTFTAVMGPSGSGKSTFLHCAAGLDRPTAGEVRLGDQDLSKLREQRLTELRRTRIGFVFQAFNLLPSLTVEQNILLPLRLAGRQPEETWLRHIVTAVDLGERLTRYPAQLSGGQQQRVAIARALAMQPKVMLFDEPTSALDPEMINEVLDVMTSLARDGMTMIVITHEMGFARRAANRVVFMADGEIVEQATPDTFFDSPQSDRARDFLSKVLSH